MNNLCNQKKNYLCTYSEFLCECYFHSFSLTYCNARIVILVHDAIAGVRSEVDEHVCGISSEMCGRKVKLKKKKKKKFYS